MPRADAAHLQHVGVLGVLHLVNQADADAYGLSLNDVGMNLSADQGQLSVVCRRTAFGPEPR